MKKGYIVFFFLFIGCLTEVHALTENENLKNKPKMDVAHFLEHTTLKGDESLLDIGCGDGSVSASLAMSLPHGIVVGVDISSAMIEFAKSKYEQIHKNLRFEIKDATSLEEAQKFDVVTSFAAMHWILDQKAALQNCHRSLKQNGKLWIQMPLGIPQALSDALQMLIKQDKLKTYFTEFSPSWKFYSPAEYRDLLEDMHFKPLFMQVYVEDDLFSSRQAFEGYLKNWFPYVRALPQEKKNEFVQELSKAYLELSPLTSEGKVKFPIKRMEVQALRL
jgi:trans-aconitate 2-methyltransferase